MSSAELSRREKLELWRQTKRREAPAITVLADNPPTANSQPVPCPTIKSMLTQDVKSRTTAVQGQDKENQVNRQPRNVVPEQQPTKTPKAQATAVAACTPATASSTRSAGVLSDVTSARSTPSDAAASRSLSNHITYKSSASTPAPSPATSTFSVDSATAAHPSDPCAETIANLLQLLPSLLSSTSDITATTVTSTATRFEYLLGTLQHAYSHQQKHSDALQTRLRNLTRSFKSNQEQLDERDRAVRVLNEEVAKGRADVEEMKRALKGESTTANFYRQEMEKLQGIAAEREEKLVSAEERAASVERVLAEVRAEKTLIEADLKERTVLVDRLMTEFVPRVRLDEALAEKEVLERDRDECYDLINDLEREHTELTATCAQLKLTNAELASVNAELTATVAEHSAVLEQKQLDHDLMDTMWQQRVFERDERMAEMTATLDALLREGELLKQEQATLLEENAVLVQNQRSVVGTAHISTMTETDDDKTNEYKAAAETLTDSAAQTSDAFLGLLKQAEIAVREFKTMKFANALMYEQMEENQRKYGTELQEARQQITYWRSVLDQTMQELEGKAMEALSASVNKCQLTESQLDGERLRTQQLEEQVEVLERHLARFLGGDMPALD